MDEKKPIVALQIGTVIDNLRSCAKYISECQNKEIRECEKCEYNRTGVCVTQFCKSADEIIPELLNIVSDFMEHLDRNLEKSFDGSSCRMCRWNYEDKNKCLKCRRITRGRIYDLSKDIYEYDKQRRWVK